MSAGQAADSGDETERPTGGRGSGAAHGASPRHPLGGGRHREGDGASGAMPGRRKEG
ncbi:hypothetical protein ACFPM0_21875 [Pseudonocardia sulfidoxydans]|uniref:hypothetical protein n=1 Tax=Pseudonocardia sulfidoxydans TaxID=54011 RepID=UPI00360BC57F